MTPATPMSGRNRCWEWWKTMNTGHSEHSSPASRKPHESSMASWLWLRIFGFWLPTHILMPFWWSKQVRVEWHLWGLHDRRVQAGRKVGWVDGQRSPGSPFGLRSLRSLRYWQVLTGTVWFCIIFLGSVKKKQWPVVTVVDLSGEFQASSSQAANPRAYWHGALGYGMLIREGCWLLVVHWWKHTGSITKGIKHILNILKHENSHQALKSISRVVLNLFAGTAWERQICTKALGISRISRPENRKRSSWSFDGLCLIAMVRSRGKGNIQLWQRC